MKALINTIRIVVILQIVALFVPNIVSGKTLSGKQENILVIGFGEKVNSNFYPKVMIADKMGVTVEAMDTLFDNLFIEKLVSQPSNRFNKVIPVYSSDLIKFKGLIKYNGQLDEIYPDIDNIPFETYKQMLESNNSDYVIIFSQYYLKKLEQPFPTLFHIVNYCVFDSSKKEVIKGMLHTNSFELGNMKDMEEMIQKNIKKNLLSLEKSIN
jgi:hypothetical protein